MEKYELLVKQFNELVDKINTYESLIDKQQKDSMDRLALMNNIFEKQQKEFEELKDGTAFFESMFKENYENIVNVLTSKLINTIMQMTDKKLLEVQNAVTPVTQAFNKANSTLQSIKDETALLEKRLDIINVIENKVTMINDSLKSISIPSENTLDHDKLKSQKRKLRNELIEITVNAKSSPISLKKVTNILQSHLNQIEDTKSLSDLTKIYNLAVLGIQDALMEDKN